MGKEITNDFSWSKSRHEKFSECLRAYYLHYYGSWGGWDLAAPPEKRELYLLKKLNNRWTWAGAMVHDTIKWALKTLRFGNEPNPALLIERAHRMMQADFRLSREHGYRTMVQRKEFRGLVEHEYDQPVTPEEWKQNWENVKGGLEWFFNSRWVPLAKSLKSEQWLEVDEGFEYSSFHFDAVKVFAIPDFAYVGDDGSAVIVDWKTGKAREGYDDQLLGYSLYLSTRYGFALDKIKTVLVYVNEGVEREVVVDEPTMDGFKERLKESVRKMRALLADPAHNVPHAEAFFPMTENLDACARCVFRRVCGRGVAAQQKVA